MVEYEVMLEKLEVTWINDDRTFARVLVDVEDIQYYFWERFGACEFKEVGEFEFIEGHRVFGSEVFHYNAELVSEIQRMFLVDKYYMPFGLEANVSIGYLTSDSMKGGVILAPRVV